MTDLHKIPGRPMGAPMAANSPQNLDNQYQERPQSRSGSGMPGMQFSTGVPPGGRPMVVGPPGKMLPPPSPSLINKRPDGTPADNPTGLTASSPRNVPMPGSQAPTPVMSVPGNPPGLPQPGPSQPPTIPGHAPALSGPSPSAILSSALPPSMPPGQSGLMGGMSLGGVGDEASNDMFAFGFDLDTNNLEFDWGPFGSDNGMPGL